MKVELSEIMDLLLKEDQAAASEKLHEWFVEQSKTIVEGFTITIDHDGDDEVAAPVMATPVAPEMEMGMEPMVDEADMDPTDDAEEFAAGDDADDMETDTFGMDDDAEAPVGDDEIPAEEELPVDERVEDLQAQLDALSAEFNALMNGEGEYADMDVDLDAEAGEEAEEDAEGDAEAETDVEESVFEDDELEETVAPGVPGKKTTFVQKSGINKDGNQSIREEDEDFADLEENYKLEPVKAEKLKSEGDTAGKGGKLKVTTKSPIPEHDADDRVGGKGVEVKGPTHKGYEREKAPAVASKDIKPKNAVQELKKVSKEGDKSAMLNKNKEDTKAKSPINGDPKLAGTDTKRK